MSIARINMAQGLALLQNRRGRRGEDREIKRTQHTPMGLPTPVLPKMSNLNCSQTNTYIVLG